MQMEEVRGCKQYLEEVLGKPVVSFAYPYGGKEDYTPDTISLVQQLSFSQACSTVPGFVSSNSDPFRLSRNSVENWNGEEFEKKLSEWFSERS
jgi:peptidoglycan/xylan/chitin deacetylase (PgdA/CDA1 family)